MTRMGFLEAFRKEFDIKPTEFRERPFRVTRPRCIDCTLILQYYRSWMHDIRVIPVIPRSIEAEQGIVKHARVLARIGSLRSTQTAIVVSHLMIVCRVHHRHESCIRLVVLLFLHEAVNYGVHVEARYELSCYHCWLGIVVIAYVLVVG
jgi:hypothetical protein